MRILKLRMQAFGPFRDKVEIDFEKFGTNGIYLISGATGSGKTTIFDAISYAWFGESSGGERDERMLRFTNAEIGVPSFVELEFGYKNKDYRIKRTLPYLRYKLRGEGTTEDNTKDVELELPSGDIINNIGEVDEYIKNLFGIDANQFSQIAMLAQGNFMELLKAPSSERADLFRKIFLTHKYKELEDNIASKFSEVKKEFDEQKLIYDQYLENLYIPIEKIEEFYGIKAYGFNDINTFVNDINKNLQENADKIYDEIESLEKEYTIQNNTRNKVIEYNEIKKNLSTQTEQFNKIIEDFKNIKLDYEKIDEKSSQRDNLKLQLNKIEQEIEKLEKLEDILNKKKEINKSIDINRKALEDIDSLIELIQNKIKTNEEYLDENKYNETKLIKISHNIENKKNEQDNIIEILEKIGARSILEKKKNELTIEYSFKDLEFNKKQTKYNNLERIFFESQAGIIAQSLKDGQPCPVCGSTEHPNPAHLENVNINQELLEERKKNLDSIKKEYDNIKSKIISINSDIQNSDKIIETSKEKFDLINASKEDLDSKKIEIDRELKELANEKLEFENIAREIIKTESELEKTKSEFNEIKIKKEKCTNEKIRLESDLENLENREEEERKLVGEKTKEELKLEEKNIDNEITNITNHVKETTEKYNKYNEEKIKLETQIKELGKRINEEYNLDLDEINSKIEGIKNKLDSNRGEQNKLVNEIRRNESQIDRLKELNKKINKTENLYINYEELNSLLKARLSEGGKIKFETYVQTKYFDEILQSANQRFNKMTDGKFSLQRKKIADNRVEQTGLDFELIDHHNRTVRNINTLSGGETFQAALSLALGLSDVVQARSGGVQLDSMFIDEGFGTLDGETLSKLMSTLLGISQHNKTIGIISHVNMLKEQIDKQIIVEKTTEGYSIIKEQIY